MYVYKELWDNEVVEIIKKFITYLRQQVALIMEMQVIYIFTTVNSIAHYKEDLRMASPQAYSIIEIHQ